MSFFFVGSRVYATPQPAPDRWPFASWLPKTPGATATHVPWANHGNGCVQGGAGATRFTLISCVAIKHYVGPHLFFLMLSTCLTCKARSSPYMLTNP